MRLPDEESDLRALGCAICLTCILLVVIAILALTWKM